MGEVVDVALRRAAEALPGEARVEDTPRHPPTPPA
jgi:hypothetical protein